MRRPAAIACLASLLLATAFATGAEVPPLRKPAPYPPHALERAISFEGFGAARFGDGEEALRKAWGEPLEDAGDPLEDCRYLVPEAPHADMGVAFMVEGGRFVRIDITDPRIRAKGGGHIGMDKAALLALYPGAIVSGHHYDDDGAYVEVPGPQGSEAAIIFETDGRGVVTVWRVGVHPQVGYVEGCA